MSPPGPSAPSPRDPGLARRIHGVAWSRLEAPASGTLWTGRLDGAPVVMKQAPTRRGFQQEVRALGILAGQGVPPLLHADPAARLLLLGRLPGAPPPPGSPAAHAAAGRWLRTLHDTPAPDDDPLPLADALARRVRGATARAAALGPLSPRTIAGLQPEAPFEPARRAWCHRDFTPRNWLWAAPATLHIVDLEHSRPDHPAWDLVKLATEVWPEHPAAADAFRQTYGPLPDPALLRRLCWLHGLQTRTWGRTHADPSYEALGQRILDGLSAPPSPG